MYLNFRVRHLFVLFWRASGLQFVLLLPLLLFLHLWALVAAADVHVVLEVFARRVEVTVAHLTLELTPGAGHRSILVGRVLYVINT